MGKGSHDIPICKRVQKLAEIFSRDISLSREFSGDFSLSRDN